MTNPADQKANRPRTWLRRTALALLALLLVNLAFAGVVALGRVQRALGTRLTSAFGRPVEVSYFQFSLLGQPRVIANYVTVSEDPRFGREHFLRAERLTAGIRWRSLLRGRLEFDTVSFFRPSLNLVRNPDGTWNLESWLPPRFPAMRAATGPAGTSPRQTLFTRIAIDEGRINFKRGVEKHPFALVNVEGYLQQEGDARWRMDLEASMMRGTVSVQEPGTLHLRGRIGSAQDRIRPVELLLTWQDASLSDALRLARGKDYGVRGQVALQVSASAPPVTVAPPAVWLFKAGLSLRDVHGWNLPQHERDPDLSLTVEADWFPSQARIEFDKLVLEAPRSNVRASGFAQWGRPQQSNLRVLSSGISLNDLLDWYRAFHNGVARDLQIEGNVGLDAELGGWPMGMKRGVLATDGARIRVPGLRVPLTLGRTILCWKCANITRPPLRFDLLPAVLAFTPTPARRNELRLDGSAAPGPSREAPWAFTLHLAGQVDRAQELLAASAAAGWPLDAGWRLEGGATLKLRWQGTPFPFAAQLSGAADLRGAVLRPPFLNEPVNLGNARIEWQPGERRVTLDSAQALGARWSGTLRSPARGEPWEFALSADRLDLAALNRWVNPRRQPGLLQRVVPFGGASRGAAEYEEHVQRLRARGRVTVDQFVLAPVALRKLHGLLEMDGRKLRLSDAQAEFFGGTVRGSLRAELAALPVYRVDAKFERVNLASLTAATTALRNSFSGTAAGELSLITRGAAREDLLRSLEGQGTLEFRDAQLRGFDLAESLRAGNARPGTSSFRSASARLRLDGERFQLDELRLKSSSAEWTADGTVDFARRVDLRLHAVAPPGRTFHLTGPFSTPQVTLRAAQPIP